MNIKSVTTDKNRVHESKEKQERRDMNIIEQNKEKVNGVLKTFDRMIVNGYRLYYDRL